MSKRGDEIPPLVALTMRFMMLTARSLACSTGSVHDRFYWSCVERMNTGPGPLSFEEEECHWRQSFTPR